MRLNFARGPQDRDRTPGVLWVREVTAHVKRLLDRDELLRDLEVRGELSNLTRASSGHLYFTLKDEESQLSAVCFRGAAALLSFEPRDGDLVVARGSITVYERAGRYQLVVRSMRPDGVGALWADLEALRARLEAEGLFDPTRKRPLPRFPRVVAICTSTTGAAVHDMTTIISRRYPLVRLVVIPTVVQGEEAPASIVRSLRIANELPQVDVVILGRGGGSAEDLWAFNDESVVRAVFASRVPVVSAVGHETDSALTDLAADARAATPSAAAEMVVPDRDEIVLHLNWLGGRLLGGMSTRLNRARVRLMRVADHPLLRRPRAVLEQRQIRADEAAEGAIRAMRLILERHRARLEKVCVGLDALNPMAVVGRGYCLCRGESGALIRSIADAPVGTRIAVTVADGDILGSVTGHRPTEEHPWATATA